MNTQIFILSLACTTFAKSDDNVAMESFRSSSYKVYPDPQDFEETDLRSQVYGNWSNSHRKGADPDRGHVEINDGVRSQSDARPGIHFGTPLYDGVSHARQRQHSTVEQRVPPKNGYSIQKHGNQQGQAEHETLEHKSEFSSVVEHISPHDEEQYSMQEDGSMKRVVPKSTVYFTMYHNDKTGKEQNTAYRTNVYHESPIRTNQEHSLPLEKTKATNQYGFNHWAHDAGEKSPVHSKTYPEQINQGAPKHAKESHAQMQYRVAPFLVAGGRPDFLSQGLQPHTSEQYLDQAGSSPFSQNIEHNLHGAPATAGTGSVLRNRSPTGSTHESKDADQIKHSGGALSKLKGQVEKKVVRLSLKNNRGRSPVQYAVTENEESAYGNAMTDSKQNAAAAAADAASSFSNAVLTRDFASWKNEQSSKQTKQYNLWKYLNEIPPIKSIDFQHSFSHLPLVYKPADSFHFEVNPYIDVGENNQGSFDHQKALEGSTSFDIKHAIGSGSGRGGGQVVSPIFEVQGAHDESDRIRPNQHIKQTALFSSPLYHVVPALSGDRGNSIFEADSSASNSDEPTSAAFEGRYIMQQQGLFKNEPVRLHLPSEKELYHHLKQVKLPNDIFSPHSKGKQHSKHYKELGWDKLLHEVHFKQPKKNQPVFNHVNRPSQKLYSAPNGDWSIYKPNLRAGKSSRIIIKTDIVPHGSEFDNIKSFPVRLRNGNSRMAKETKGAVPSGKILAASLIRRPRKASSESGVPDSGRPASEFFVTASYRADRSLKKGPLK